MEMQTLVRGGQVASHKVSASHEADLTHGHSPQTAKRKDWQ